MESWEFDVLAALRRAGAPYELSPGRLLKETLVTSGTMTNRVDRLETRALVQRLPDPKDRRGVLVRLTEDGREVVDTALDDLLARERGLLAELDGASLDSLAAALRQLEPLRRRPLTALPPTAFLSTRNDQGSFRDHGEP